MKLEPRKESLCKDKADCIRVGIWPDVVEERISSKEVRDVIQRGVID